MSGFGLLFGLTVWGMAALAVGFLWLFSSGI